MSSFFQKTSWIFIGLFFLLILIFGGCEPDFGNLITSPKILPPVIFAFLNTAADSQYVIIRNALPPQNESPRFIEAEYRRLRQSLVSIESSGERFDFPVRYEVERYFDDYRNFIFVSTNRVRSGEIYRLRVEIPEKGVFSALTKTPGDFQIYAPNPVDTIDVFHPLTVRWTAAEGAAGYRLGVWALIENSRYSNKVTKRWIQKKSWYLEASSNPEVTVEHGLDFYYKLPEDSYVTLLQAALSVEALDSPAWLVRDINRPGPLNEEEFRLETVAYSNIEGGRGVMTATTTKTISLLIPPHKR